MISLNETSVVVVRAIIGFFTLLIFARLLGKQQIGQLTFFDYIIGITIGSTASTLTTDLTSTAWLHWVGLAIWCLCAFILQLITVKFRAAENYIDGKPTLVIINGKIMEKSMRKIRYSLGELLLQLRDKGVFNLDEVAYAILETNGNLSVLKKSQHQPVTPKDLNINTQKATISTEVIYNGKVIDENLELINKDMKWLKDQLKKQGIQNPSQVHTAATTQNGDLYVDLIEDHMK